MIGHWGRKLSSRHTATSGSSKFSVYLVQATSQRYSRIPNPCCHSERIRLPAQGNAGRAAKKPQPTQRCCSRALATQMNATRILSSPIVPSSLLDSKRTPRPSAQGHTPAYPSRQGEQRRPRVIVPGGPHPTRTINVVRPIHAGFHSASGGGGTIHPPRGTAFMSEAIPMIIGRVCWVC